MPIVAETTILARRLAFVKVEVDVGGLAVTTAGECSVDERLEIRGIFVGVSFVSMDDLG